MALRNIAPVPPEQRLMSVQDVAEYLGVPVKSVYAFAYEGGGPKMIKIGNKVRYTRESIDAWLAENTRP